MTITVTSADSTRATRASSQDQNADRKGIQVMGATYTVPAGDAFVMTRRRRARRRRRPREGQGPHRGDEERCAAEGAAADDRFASPTSPACWRSRPRTPRTERRPRPAQRPRRPRPRPTPAARPGPDAVARQPTFLAPGIVPRRWIAARPADFQPSSRSGMSARSSCAGRGSGRPAAFSWPSPPSPSSSSRLPLRRRPTRGSRRRGRSTSPTRAARAPSPRTRCTRSARPGGPARHARRLDIGVTKDGKVVVMHDTTLNGETSGHGTVASRQARRRLLVCARGQE